MPVGLPAQVSRAILPAPNVSGMRYRQVFEGLIGGSGALSELTNNAAYPGSPSAEYWETGELETPWNRGDAYGQRLRALLIAPTSGVYTFQISSDDNSALYLSTNASPTGKILICRVPGWTGGRARLGRSRRESNLLAKPEKRSMMRA